MKSCDQAFHHRRTWSHLLWQSEIRTDVAMSRLQFLHARLCALFSSLHASTYTCQSHPHHQLLADLGGTVDNHPKDVHLQNVPRCSIPCPSPNNFPASRRTTPRGRSFFRGKANFPLYRRQMRLHRNPLAHSINTTSSFILRRRSFIKH